MIESDEERLTKLFKRLDRDSNGKIDIFDLSAALKEFGVCETYAQVSNYNNLELNQSINVKME